ncbi:MAG: isoaspartyl peptidase/L-asparaginase family protein [Thermoplasmata archaeon]
MTLRIVTNCGAGSGEDAVELAEKAGRVGMAILDEGGSAVDAVVETIVVLEDDPRTNAGLGSRLRLDGSLQMDASVMDSDLNCGCVAGIRDVRNPIAVARKLIDTPHIMLAGEGAISFARKVGFEHFDPKTEKSVERLELVKRKLQEGDLPEWARKWKDYHVGTVGAVAVDGKGKMAAGNSTGGTSFMLPGRVGDTPIIGAGIYCGSHGAVSATGIGEEIVRLVLSLRIFEKMGGGMSARDACEWGISLFPQAMPVGVIAASRSDSAACSNRTMASWIGEA